MATTAQAFVAARSGRWFYTAMNLAILATVFLGFSRSYYLSAWIEPGERPPLSPLLHVHGAVATGWFILMVVQPSLVATRNVRLHTRLGVAAAALAVAMTLLGILVGIEAVGRGSGGALGDPRMGFSIPFFGALLFGGLVAAAIGFRRKPQVHKRLMLLSSAAIIDAATGRIFPVAEYGLPALFAGPIGVIGCGMTHDIWTRGRVHAVWVWGGALVIIVHLLRLPLMFTETWLRFTDAIVALARPLVS